MDSTDSLIKLLASIFGVVGGVTAVFAAVGALVLSSYSKHKPVLSEASPDSGSRDEILRIEERVIRWRRWIRRVLATGQLLVFLVIASSLFKATLSKRYLGMLGLVLFLCHLVQHRFGFDLQKIGAEERGHEGAE